MMKKASFSFSIALAVTGSVLSFTPPTSAQELNLGPIIDPGIAGQAAAQRQIAEQEYKRATGHAWRDPSRGTRSAKGSISSGRIAHGSTRFQVSQVARQRRVAAWMSKLRAVDSKSMAQFQRQLAGRDLFTLIQPQLARYGLRTDDVADAMAVYLVSAWYGVRGSNQDPPRAHLLATRNQMRTVLLANPAFASTSNATKQQLAESLLLQTIEDDSYIKVGKKDPGQMARAKSLIRQNAMKTFKLDLTKLKLTSQGLRI